MGFDTAVIINFIGGGRLGKTLARLMVLHHAATIGAVCNRTLASAATAVHFIGEGKAVSELSALPPADITFITTHDDVIKDIANTLNQSDLLKAGSLLVHCSGVKSSALLKSSTNNSYAVASVHPMKSFVSPALSVDSFCGTYCAVEGEKRALPLITDLFKAIGANTYTIEPEKKALYHASGVFAANYLQGLAAISLDCLSGSGVDEDKSIEIVIELMQGALDNLKRTGSARKALTGPLLRGDVQTIQAHLAALSGQPRAVYQQLALSLLATIDHPSALTATLLALLNAP